jgi:hypothetical protein
MLSRKADEPLTVQIPVPAEDRPSWTRVGVIAAIGFIVGVAWPRLAGVRLGPSVPEAAASSTASSAPSSDQALVANGPPLAPPTSASATPDVVAPAVVAVPAPTASGSAGANLSVAHGIVFACKTTDGDSLKAGECGSLPGLDSIVMPRLHQLADCPEAATSTGKLHLVIHVDFARGGLGVDLGRGHGVSSPDALLACAKTALHGVGLGGIPHENPRYTVAYAITFAAAAPSETPVSPAAPERSGAEAAHGADGTAQVVWEVAIVRDAPKTGKVVARLQHGSELRLGTAKDGWYPVKFGDGFASDGWVYRGAIGK